VVVDLLEVVVDLLVVVVVRTFEGVIVGCLKGKTLEFMEFSGQS